MMTAPKPKAKPPRIRQQILAALIDSKPKTRKHKVWDETLNGGKGDAVETTVSTGRALTFPLAQNVSGENVERLSKRWF